MRLQLLTFCAAVLYAAAVDGQTAETITAAQQALEEGKIDDAERHFVKACGPDVQVPDESIQALCLHGIAAIRNSRGDIKESLELYLKADAIWERHPDQHPAARAATLSNLGDIYESLGDWTKSAAMFETALELDRNYFGPAHVRTAGAMTRLAKAYVALSRFTAADALLTRAREIQRA